MGMYTGNMTNDTDTPVASASTALRETTSWYDANAEEFCKETGALSMEHAYEAFLPFIPEGGRILDAGCGSGRDSERFMQAGFAVEAFDASPQMARCAAARTGLEVRVLAFADMDWNETFDGVFANASLLHVPPDSLSLALERIAAALKPGGVLFASLKHGQGGYKKHGKLHVWRHEAASLDKLLRHSTSLEPIRTWTTADTRPKRAHEHWLHLLARKTAT